MLSGNLTLESAERTFANKPGAGRDCYRKRLPNSPLVVGGMALDITSTVEPCQVGVSNYPFRLGNTSHPGKISFSAGGVGRNIAEAAARCLRFAGGVQGDTISVGFVTACGDDMPSRMLLSHMQAAGVSTDCVLIRADGRTAIYNAIHSPTGDLIGAVADMRILESLTGAELKSAIRSTAPSIVVFDANLDPKAIAALLDECQECSIPAFFEPTSVPKSRRLFDASPRAVSAGVVRYASPNDYEMAAMAEASQNMERQMISGGQDEPHTRQLNERISLEDWQEETKRVSEAIALSPSQIIDLTLHNAAILLRYIPTLFIKMGAKGAVLAERRVYKTAHEWPPMTQTAGGSRTEVVVEWKCNENLTGMIRFCHLAVPHAGDRKIVSVTGAGDSFVGAVVAGLAAFYDSKRGDRHPAGRQDLADLVEAGQVAALRSLATKEAVSTELSRDILPKSWRIDM